MDWHRISHALLMARTSGYKQIHTDWIVAPQFAAITKPPDAIPMNVSGAFAGELVASGEIGLLKYLASNPPEPNSKFVTCTPCFRHETEYIPGFKEPWFLKVELMIANPSDDLKAAAGVLAMAKIIMGTWTRKLVFDASIGDLNLNGIEVGSYGIREHQGLKWAYGTGLAEPRFGYALTQGKR